MELKAPPLEAAKFASSAGNKARAETLYNNIIDGKHELEIIAEAAFELGKMLEQQQRYGEALGFTKRANHYQPKLDYKTAIYKLQQRSEELKKALDKKVEAHKVELKVNSDNPDKVNEIHLQIAEAYRESDVRLKAIEHYHEARKNIESSIKEAISAQDETTRQQKTGAEQEKQQAALAAIDSKLAQCYYEMKKYDDSIAHCKLVLEQGNATKPDIAILNLRAWNHYKKGEFEPAREIFEELSKINNQQNTRYSTDEINNQKNIAWCYYELKKRRHAAKHFKDAVNIYKKAHIKTRIGVADVYMLLGWFYYDYGCYEKRPMYFDMAEKQFSRAHKRLEKVLGENDIKVKYAVNWINHIPEAKEKNQKSWLQKIFE